MGKKENKGIKGSICGICERRDKGIDHKEAQREAVKPQETIKKYSWNGLDIGVELPLGPKEILLIVTEKETT